MNIDDLLKRDDISDDARIAIRREFATCKEAESRLRHERDIAEDLIAAAPVVFLVLDSVGRIVRYNKHLEELSGRPLAETRGEDWFATFLPEREHIRIRRVFLQTVDDMPTSGTVNAITTADGREVPLTWYNRTLKDAEGKTVGVLSVGREQEESA